MTKRVVDVTAFRVLRPVVFEATAMDPNNDVRKGNHLIGNSQFVRRMWGNDNEVDDVGWEICGRRTRAPSSHRHTIRLNLRKLLYHLSALTTTKPKNERCDDTGTLHYRSR